MMEAPKRSTLRRQTILSKTTPKGFLKIAREKLMKQKTLTTVLLEAEKPTKHVHRRSLSANFSTEDSESPNSPALCFIRKPQGDFGDFYDCL
ncbi:hypothetical protein SteCoe_3659 [Stentor coeruleus]|uniref:Uncharacterized protein n=1 Tax=Stentor coeruleus TaxID=5963 RepID=A0A1R2CWR1_9CILI|nr:hypothetical protein SteCoe_3659 [Stentor coeruleus]